MFVNLTNPKSIEKSVLAKLKADYQTHLRGLLPSTIAAISDLGR